MAVLSLSLVLLQGRAALLSPRLPFTLNKMISDNKEAAAPNKAIPERPRARKEGRSGQAWQER
jgi:hypothetical protein